MVKLGVPKLDESVDFWMCFGPKTSNIAPKVLKPTLKSFLLHARYHTTQKLQKLSLHGPKCQKVILPNLIQLNPHNSRSALGFRAHAGLQRRGIVRDHFVAKGILKQKKVPSNIEYLKCRLIPITPQEARSWVVAPKWCNPVLRSMEQDSNTSSFLAGFSV